jgi:hypothetical protein
MSTPRDLNENEKDLLYKILSRSRLGGGAELLAQIPSTRVSGGRATLLELNVADDASPSSSPDGPVPVRALAEGPRGDPLGEVIVWVSGGFLSGLEYAWVTDETPTTMPPAAIIRIG